MVRSLLPHHVVAVGVVVASVHVVGHLQQLRVLPVGVGGQTGEQGDPAGEGGHGGVVGVLQPPSLAGPAGRHLTAARTASHHLGPS